MSHNVEVGATSGAADYSPGRGYDEAAVHLNSERRFSYDKANAETVEECDLGGWPT